MNDKKLCGACGFHTKIEDEEEGLRCWQCSGGFYLLEDEEQKRYLAHGLYNNFDYTYKHMNAIPFRTFVLAEKETERLYKKGFKLVVKHWGERPLLKKYLPDELKHKGIAL